MTARAITGYIGSAKAYARMMLGAVSGFLDETPDNYRNNYGENMTARAITGDIGSGKAYARMMLGAVSRLLDETPDNYRNNYGSKYGTKSNNRRYRFW